MKKLMASRPLYMIIVSVSLTAGLLWLVAGSRYVYRAATTAKPNLRYVLVNEDRGAKDPDGKHVDFGKRFVERVNNDHEHNWTTASRDFANEGYNRGDFDVQITLPSDFSEKLANLESVNPDKPQIPYRIREGESSASNRATQKLVSDVLTDFNRQVIRTYFHSVIDRLTNAQKQLSGIVGGYDTQNTALQNQVVAPLRGLPSNFNQVNTMAGMLEQANASYQSQQDNFSKFAVSNLDSSAQSIHNGQSQLESFLDYQNKMSQGNVMNMTQGLKQQTASDTRLYQQFNGQVGNQLALFSPANPQGFLTQFHGYNDNQKARIAEIKQQIKDINKQVDDLQATRRNVSQYYFGTSQLADKSLDKTKHLKASDFAKDDAGVTQAITKLLPDADQKAPEASHLPDSYLKSVDRTANQIDPDSLGKLINKLEADHKLPAEQVAGYRQRLALLKRYNTERNVGNSGAEASFKYLEPKKSAQLTDGQVMSCVLSLEVSGSKETKVTFQERDGLTLQKPVAVSDQLQKELGPTYKVGLQGQTITILPDSKDKLADRHVGVSVTYGWQLSDPVGYHEVVPSWQANTAVLSNKLAVFYDNQKDDQALTSDLPTIVAQLGDLETATSTLATVFGPVAAGNQRDNFAAYYAYVTHHKDSRLSDCADERSLYRMYNTMTASQRQQLVVDAIREKFVAQGVDLYNQLLDQETQLSQLVTNSERPGSLTATMALLTQPETLNQKEAELLKWYENANKLLDDQSKQWQVKPELILENRTGDNGEVTGQANRIAIHTDTHRGNDLMKSYQALAQSARSSSDNVKTSSAQVKSINDQFKTLTSQTSNVKKNSEDVISQSDSLVKQIANDTQKNKTYADDFSKVMANTHDGGKANNQVYDFLSDPLAVQPQVTEHQQTSLMPYLVTIVLAMTGALLAYILQTTDSLRKLQDKDTLHELSRFWYNKPFTVKALLAATFASAVITFTVGHIAGTHRYPFLLTVGALLLTTILVLTTLFRFTKRLGLLIFAATFGLYLMLANVLGVAIAKGSWILWLYNASPWQKIENAITIMSNGGVMSWSSIALTLVTLLLCIVLNLVKTPKEKYDFSA